MRVGTRATPLEVSGTTEDHPHACGDKLFAKLVIAPLGGSSPCVWGQEPICIIIPSSFRIIPMRVGTSCPHVRACCARRDHPHACGDKTYPTPTFTTSEGSSPCVWGQDCGIISVSFVLRIIPMRVGTRLRVAGCHCRSWDHPHACGDKVPFPLHQVI